MIRNSLINMVGRPRFERGTIALKVLFIRLNILNYNETLDYY